MEWKTAFRLMTSALWTLSCLGSALAWHDFVVDAPVLLVLVPWVQYILCGVWLLSTLGMMMDPFPAPHLTQASLMAALGVSLSLYHSPLAGLSLQYHRNFVVVITACVLSGTYGLSMWINSFLLLPTITKLNPFASDVFFYTKLIALLFCITCFPRGVAFGKEIIGLVWYVYLIPIVVLSTHAPLSVFIPAERFRALWFERPSVHLHAE
jgi:predicted membrane protein